MTSVRFIKSALIICSLLAAFIPVLSTGCFQKKADVAQMKYHCPMHPTYVSNKAGSCPICGMDLVPINSAAAQNGNAKDIAVDPAMRQTIGAASIPAERRDLSRLIHAAAVIAPDERKQSVVSVRTSGYVEKLEADFSGRRVKLNETLCELYSPELVAAQNEFLLNTDATARKASRDRLVAWGMNVDEIATIEKEGSAHHSVAVHSPRDGFVVEKDVIQGQKVESGSTIFRIADYSTVWAIAALHQIDAVGIKVGTTATVRLDADPAHEYHGTITWIAPYLDTAALTLAVRIELHNTQDFTIRPGMTASVNIDCEMSHNMLCIPSQALIRTGLRSAVVIDKGEGDYEIRDVKIGSFADSLVEIVSGLSENEKVLIAGQFLIDAESSLREAATSMNTPVTTMDNADTMPPKVPDTLVKKTGNWYCPMDTEVRSDVQGKCPKCGMKLIKKK